MLKILMNSLARNTTTAVRGDLGKDGFGRPLIALAIFLFAATACDLSTQSGSSDGVTAVPLATPVPSGGACANPLFPVMATAVWNYHVGGGPTGDFDYSSIIASVGADGFEMDSHINGVLKSEIWKCNPTGLAALAPGGGVSANLTTPNSSVELTTTDSAGDTLPNSVAAGDTWAQVLTLHGEHSLSGGTKLLSDGTYTSHYTAAGMETVKVPAGSFNAMRIDIESNWVITTTVSGVTVPVHLNITSSVWFAPGIGMVKTVTVVEDITSTVELTSYSLP